MKYTLVGRTPQDYAKIVASSDSLATLTTSFEDSLKYSNLDNYYIMDENQQIVAFQEDNNLIFK